MGFESFPQNTSPRSESEPTPEKNGVEIPAFISRNVEQELADLGWGSDERRKLTPEEAISIIKNQETHKNEKKNQDNESTIHDRDLSEISKSAETEKLIPEIHEDLEDNALKNSKPEMSSQETPRDASRPAESVDDSKYPQENLPTENAEEQKEIPDSTESNRENGERNGENGENSNEDSEGKREIIGEIRNKIGEGFKLSKKHFFELRRRYIDSADIFKDTITGFRKKYPEVVKPETEIDVTAKTEKSKGSFEKTIDDFAKREFFLLFDVNSLEQLLLANPENTSPEKLKEIQETISIERLKEIDSSTKDYFQRIDEVENRWEELMEDFKNTLTTFDVNSYSQGINNLLLYLDSERILRELELALSDTPEIRGENERNHQENINYGDDEYISHEVGTRKKKGPEDRFGFTQVEKERI